jgi:hypothetical protein
LEPERERVRSAPLKSPGVLMDKTTLIWDSSNGNNKKNNQKNLKIQTKRNIFYAVCTKFMQNFKKLFFCCFNSDVKDDAMVLPSDFEDVMTTYDSDEEGDEGNDNENNENTENDEFPLILGDTEESHMMAVYKAQVSHGGMYRYINLYLFIYIHLYMFKYRIIYMCLYITNLLKNLNTFLLYII